MTLPDEHVMIAAGDVKRPGWSEGNHDVTLIHQGCRELINRLNRYGVTVGACRLPDDGRRKLIDILNRHGITCPVIENEPAVMPEVLRVCRARRERSNH